MQFSFLATLPNILHPEPILISGFDSTNLSEVEYLVISEGKSLSVFEMRYNHHCSPFKQAQITGHFLIVGHENYFYIFDLLNRINVLRLEMEGYFGHLYVENNLYYVADSNGLYCLASDGNIVWENKDLGIDGVIINSFDEDNIYGAGEWDPPGGWRDFVLEKKTGRLLS